MCCWLYHLDNGQYSISVRKFQAGRVNGTKLFGLNRISMQNNIKILDAKQRNGILTEIKSLKKQMRIIDSERTKEFARKNKSKRKRSNSNWFVFNFILVFWIL